MKKDQASSAVNATPTTNETTTGETATPTTNETTIGAAATPMTNDNASGAKLQQPQTSAQVAEEKPKRPSEEHPLEGGYAVLNEHAPGAVQQSPLVGQLPEAVRDSSSRSFFPPDNATNEQLDADLDAALVGLVYRTADADHYLDRVVIPACHRMIQRFKMPGVAAKNRPRGMPTVQDYFWSVHHLSYNTVRSWFHRQGQRIVTERVFEQEKPKRLTERDKASLALVKVIREGGDIGEAANEVAEALSDSSLPTPDLDHHPKEELPVLTLRLVGEVEAFFREPNVPSMPEPLKGVVANLNAVLKTFVIKKGQRSGKTSAEVEHPPRPHHKNVA
jgi:hypothetical protein